MARIGADRGRSARRSRAACRLALVATWIAAGGCASGSADPDAALRARARTCAPALFAFEPSLAESCIHPRLSAFAGSSEQFIGWLTAMHERLEAEGAKIEITEVGAPGPTTDVGGHRFSVIPVEVHLSRGDEEADQSVSLVGVLDPDAPDWTFVDGESVLRGALPRMFPELDAAALAAAAPVPAARMTRPTTTAPERSAEPLPDEPTDFRAEERRRAIECHETADRLAARGLQSYSDRIRSTCGPLEPADDPAR